MEATLISSKLNDNLAGFFEQHQVENNKFESFKEAEAFFNRMGFKLDKVASPGLTKLSTLKYLVKNATLLQLIKLRRESKVQSTWRLKVASQ